MNEIFSHREEYSNLRVVKVNDVCEQMRNEFRFFSGCLNSTNWHPKVILLIEAYVAFIWQLPLTQNIYIYLYADLRKEVENTKCQPSWYCDMMYNKYNSGNRSYIAQFCHSSILMSNSTKLSIGVALYCTGVVKGINFKFFPYLCW